MNKKIIIILTFMLLVCVSIVYAQGIPQADIYLAFDNNTLQDSYGNLSFNNTGTTNTTGIIYSGRNLDGTTASMTAADNLFTDGNVFTINMWVFPNSIDGADGLITKRTDPNINFDFFYSSASGDITSRVYDGCGGGSPTVASSLTAGTGAWHMITWVLNGSQSDSIKLYIDGVEDTTFADAGTWGCLTNNSITLRLGSLRADTSFLFDGVMDEIGIWRGYTLNQTEIDALYNSGSPDLQPPFTTPPIGDGPYSGNITYPTNSNVYNISPSGKGVNFLSAFYYNGTLIDDSYFGDVNFDNITVIGSSQYELSVFNYTYSSGVWNVTTDNFTLPVDVGTYNLSVNMIFNTSYVYNMTSNNSVYLQYVNPDSPLITIYSPVNNSVVTSPVFFNLTVNDTNNLSRVFYNNGSENITLFSSQPDIGVTNATSAYNFENNNFSDYYGLYNATNGGTTNTTGIIGDGRFINTEGTYRNITIPQNAISSNNFSIELWVNMNNSTGTFDPIIVKRSSGAIDWQIYQDNTQNKVCLNFVGSTSGSWFGCNTHNLTLGAWTQIAVVVNNISNPVEGVKYYENGVPVNFTYTTNAVGNVKNTLPITLGAFDGVNIFVGSMDAVKLWNGYTLTDDEVYNLYNSGAGLQPPFNTTSGNFNNTFSTDFSLNLSSGSYNYIFYANDSFGALSSESLYFSIVDSIPAWTPYGRVGGGLIFDGVNDYLKVNDFNGSGSTVTMWINRINPNIGGPINSSGWALMNPDVTTVIGDDTYRNFTVSDLAVTSVSLVGCVFNPLQIYRHTPGFGFSSNYCFNENSTWQNLGTEDILFIYDYIVWDYLTYRDGINYTNLVVNSSEKLPYYITGGTLYIGNYSNGSLFKGAIDEFQYYNYSLSDEQLQLNYDNGLLGLPNYELAVEEVEDNATYQVLTNLSETTSSINYNIPFWSTMDFLQFDFFPLPHATVEVEVRDLIFNNSQPFDIDFYGTANNYSFSWTPTLIPFCTPDNETDCYETPNFLVDLETYNISLYNNETYNNCSYVDQVFDNETTYTLNSCIFYNNVLTVYAYNGYTNDTIENFTVYIDANYTDNYDWAWQENYTTNQTAIGNNVSFNLTYPGNYTIIITHPDYLNSTVTNYYVSTAIQTLNQSMESTNITFNFRHIATGDLLSGVNITFVDLNNSYTYYTTTGILNIAPPSGENIYFNASALNYVPILVNYTFSGGEINTYNVSMQPVINFSFLDEKTFDPFNMNSPDEIKAELYCQDDTVVTTIISNSSSVVPFNITCEFKKIRFVVDYPTEAYYRVIVISPTINDTNFNVWLVDLNTSKVVYNTFQSYDLFSNYENVKIGIYRLINESEELITGDFVDIESKITAFLLLNEEYTIKVFSDNNPDRIIGRYNADDSGIKYLRLFDITVSPSPASFGTDVSYYMYLVNETGSYNIKVGYNDTTGVNLANVTVNIRNGSRTGPLLFSSSSTNSEAIFTWPTLGAPNNGEIYDVELIMTRFDSTNVTDYAVLQDTIIVTLPDFKNAWSLRWFIYIIILIFAFSMTAKTAAVGNLLILALLLLLSAVNIFVVSDSTAIALGVIGILGLLAITTMLKRGA